MCMHRSIFGGSTSARRLLLLLLLLLPCPAGTSLVVEGGASPMMWHINSYSTIALLLALYVVAASRLAVVPHHPGLHAMHCTSIVACLLAAHCLRDYCCCCCRDISCG
jgi:hypothetical protein